MKVKCIDNSSGFVELTINKEYEVIGEEWLFGEKAYKLKDDTNKLKPYMSDRFEIVKEDKEMKELTLQEVFNYKDGTKFKMGFDNFEEEQYVKLRLSCGDLWYDRNNRISDVYDLKGILEAKYYLLEQWKEIDYYTAYTNTNSNIKYINGDEEIKGTHYGILSNLDSRCKKTGEDLTRLLADAKWYVKVV